MRILCICRSGLYRSVETKRQLNKMGYNDVIAVGSSTIKKDTLDILCNWADNILLAKPAHGKKIKRCYRWKIDENFYIGDDLQETVKKQLKKIKL